jgi:hypothetical protein
MRPGHLAEQRSERVLAGIGEMVLIPQEDHPVPEQRCPYLGYRLGVEVTADLHAADDSADRAADLSHLDLTERLACRHRILFPHLSHPAAPLLVA